MSFLKGEVLDIVDKRGKWWQVRKVDGTIGSMYCCTISILQALNVLTNSVAPSNYLQVISSSSELVAEPVPVSPLLGSIAGKLISSNSEAGITSPDYACKARALYTCESFVVCTICPLIACLTVRFGFI